jgi:predicted PurR-regulated permease PerM
LVGREFAPDDLQLLIDQVGQDLGHLLPAPSLEELLLGRVAIAERDWKPESLQLGQVAEDGPFADLQNLGKVEGPDARPGGCHRQDDQEPMQATCPIHVAERSTAYMGLQFDDAAYNRPMSAVVGEPRRFRSRIPGTVWLAAGILVALAIAYLARQIILPFVLALFLTYLLLPAVNAMSTPAGGRRGTPRVVASFLALAAFIGVLVVAILVLAPLVAGEANRLGRAMFSTGGNEPALARRLAATFQAWRDTIYGTGVFPPDVERQLDQEVRDVVAGIGETVGNMVQGSFALFPKLLELIAVPLLTFYMLLDGPRLMREARGFLPPTRQDDARELMKRLNRTLLEYVRGQLMTSVFIGLVATVGLFVIGLKMALLVGVIAFFLEAIPFFGPLIWGSLAVVLALAQAGPGNPLPIFVGIFALVAQQVDSHVFAPWILGRFTRVHPLLLIFSTLLGASLFGLIGMFLAAPITALAKETFLFMMERVKARRGAASLSVSA